MARKPTGKGRGRPKGQSRLDYDFSQLVEWLFVREVEVRGSTYDEAKIIVQCHPDIVEFFGYHPKFAASLTEDAIQKRFQRAMLESSRRMAEGLSGIVPTLPDWEIEAMLRHSPEPVDPEAFARRPKFTRRRDRGGD